MTMLKYYPKIWYWYRRSFRQYRYWNYRFDIMTNAVMHD